MPPAGPLDQALGVSPGRYVLLRRLKQVRIALRDAHPDTANVGELARGCGFTGLARFVEVYHAVFGETPSITSDASLKRGSPVHKIYQNCIVCRKSAA